jgi:hypothetical protein
MSTGQCKKFPSRKYGLQLRDGQSADDFMLETERRVNLMIGEYTMNEYKAYKNLVKHKRRINWVFSEVCKDKYFHSRRPGHNLKMPAIAVASCSAVPPKAPRRRSSKSSLSIADETTSSGVLPSKKSLLSLPSSANLPKKFRTLNSRRPPALLRWAARKLRRLLKRLSLLKFGGSPPLSLMTSSWSPARKVFLLAFVEIQFS